MVCLPSRDKCEERILEPFVAYYNSVSQAAFDFEARLDIANKAPQPEALYIDRTSGAELVIERKYLVWPPNYAQIHDSLHTVAAVASALIQPHLDASQPYRLWMPDRIAGSIPELRCHAHSIAETVIENLSDVIAGKPVESDASGREWSFRIQETHERNFDEPSAGLEFVFAGQFWPLDWDKIPPGLVDVFVGLLQAVHRKFADHSSRRRILVLDLIGEIRHPTRPVLEKLFELCAVPQEIDEIWTFTHDLITELDYGWSYQKLWPTCCDQAYELCGGRVSFVSD